MGWGFEFYEPLFICLFNAQWTVTLSFNSLHGSSGDSQQRAACRSQKGYVAFEMTSLKWLEERWFCLFVCFIWLQY